MPVLDRQARGVGASPDGGAPTDGGASPAGGEPADAAALPGACAARAARESPAHRPVPGELPPSLRGLPPRSVPETRPTPLQRSYVLLSVIPLVCGAVAISALELGASLRDPLVRLCVVVGAPILFVVNCDATLRIWRSAWAWMAVDRTRGLFRLSWVVVAVILLAVLAVATVVVLVS